MTRRMPDGWESTMGAGTRRRASTLCLVLVLSVAGGCGGSETASRPSPSAALPSTAAEPAGLQVVEARAQLMPGMGAVYLRVVNKGDQGDRLVSIETPIARLVETHETVEKDGVMRMVPHPEGFEIPPGGSVDLVPGGKHAMLIDPQTPDGETIPLTLHFRVAPSIEVEATVMAMGAMDHGTDRGAMDHGTEHGAMEHLRR